MKKLVLFFIDGLGLGEDSDEVNPVRGLFSGILNGNLLVRRDAPLYFPGGVLIPTDPKQGVPGIPQSATGQTSIFTGINAQKMLGYHLTGFPNEELKVLIEERSLMKALEAGGVRTTAANLYSKEFFESRRASRRNLLPVSTLTIQASGADFRYAQDYHVGRAVFADITNNLIRERGYDIELIQPEKAALHMLNILSDYDFVFFEYFMTDLYGHKRNREQLERCVEVLDRFTTRVWDTVERASTGILIVSDHGNAEDMSTGDHTSNLVPTILLRENREDQRIFTEKVRDLTDIYGAVLAYFGIEYMNPA